MCAADKQVHANVQSFHQFQIGILFAGLRTEDDVRMADNWTDKMQAHFNELKRDIQSQFDKQKMELTAVITTELGTRRAETEHRLTERIDNRLGAAEGRLSERFDAAEGRLASQFKTGFEALRDQVRQLAEAFGGTLDGLRRDIRTLDEKFSSRTELHGRVLAEHSRDIADLKRKL